MPRYAKALDPPPDTRCRWMSCSAKPTHRIASECVLHGRMTEDFCELHVKEVMAAKKAGAYVCGEPAPTRSGDCDTPLKQSEPIELPTEEAPCPSTT